MLKKIYHINAGETEMYEIDARQAVTKFPEEWADEPWPEGDKKKTKDASAADIDFVAPYEGKDKGAGWWAIFDANSKQIGGNIRKPEAETFNGMSDEEKQEWVEVETTKS
jgi:hypothetical protein